MDCKDDNWVHCFFVSDPIKHKKGFTLYKVKSVTYSKKFPDATTEIIVWKRYSDFKKLHSHLKQLHIKLKISGEFPTFIKANYFSRFENDVIEERRISALLLLEFIAKHAPLCNSDNFTNFFKKSYSVILEEGTSTLTSSGDSAVENELSTTPERLHEQECSSLNSKYVSLNDTGSFSSSQINCNSWDGITFDNGTHSEPIGVDRSYENSLEGIPNDFEDENPKQTLAIFTKKLWDLTSIKSRISPFSSFNGKPEYFSLAEQYVEEAELKESMKNYRAAFDLYKKAVSFWLSGVQNEMNRERRKMIKEQTSKCLLRAEYLANYYLTDEISAMSSVKVVPLTKLWQPVSHLVNYKVINVVHKVLLVMDMNTHSLHVVKALLKSFSPAGRNKKCILPRGGPYMVNLHAVFETDHAVYLVMEHISTGRLWDYIKPFFMKDVDSFGQLVHSNNPYVGRRIIEDISECPTLSENLKEPVSCSLTDLTLNSSQSSLSSEFESYVNICEDCDLSQMYGNSNYSSLNNGSLISANSNSEAVPKKTPIIIMNMDDNVAPTYDESENAYCHSIDQPAEIRKEGSSSSVDNPEDIGLLVEKSQQLLKSVSQTLIKSSCLNKTDTSFSDRLVDNLKTDIAIEIDTSELDKIDKVVNENENTDVPLINANLSPTVKRDLSPISTGSDVSEIHWTGWGSDGSGLKPDIIVKWAAQLLVAIGYLHNLGIILRDLNPENILITSQGNICLTYQCQFPGVEPILSTQAITEGYTAPECIGITPLTFSVDWWSYGAILYNLITGYSLNHFHPGGFLEHSSLYIPDYVPSASRSLLCQLLTHDTEDRLGSTQHGIEEIKKHLFFEGVDWDKIIKEGNLA